MEKKRKVYAPFSLTSEAGVAQTPVEGYIDVNQTIYPTVSTGTINENGKWTGVKASDDEFIGLTRAEAVANNGSIQVPDTNNNPSVNMFGFTDIFIALKVSNGGNYAITATVGPDTTRFANLSPVNAGATILRAIPGHSPPDLETAFLEAGTTLTADVWNIFAIYESLANVENVQFKWDNLSGGNSNMEFAFRRIL
jgi:hypothetical protein